MGLVIVRTNEAKTYHCRIMNEHGRIGRIAAKLNYCRIRLSDSLHTPNIDPDLMLVVKGRNVLQVERDE